MTQHNPSDTIYLTNKLKVGCNIKTFKEMSPDDKIFVTFTWLKYISIMKILDQKIDKEIVAVGLILCLLFALGIIAFII